MRTETEAAVRQKNWRITAANYEESFLQFQDRQAGIALVYDPQENRYYYNAYCVERTLLKELFAVEHSFLEDALETLHAEFGTWEVKSFAKKQKSGCDSCVAK